jgi:hypothetical protein
MQEQELSGRERELLALFRSVTLGQQHAVERLLQRMAGADQPPEETPVNVLPFRAPRVAS